MIFNERGHEERTAVLGPDIPFNQLGDAWKIGIND